MSQHFAANIREFAQYQPGVPWDQQQFYQYLTQTHIPLGGQTTYDETPPEGFNGVEDKTCFVYGQRAITSSNWPDFMYLLIPPPEWQAYKKSNRVQPKKDGNNNVILERWPRQGNNKRGAPCQRRPLRNFPGLPDQISSQEKWWRIVLWRRLYPNLAWEDIIMRMEPEIGDRTDLSDVRKRDSLNMQCCRTFNVKFCMTSWHLKGNRGRPRQDVLALLSPAQITANTTRGVTPGLIDPALGDTPNNRVPLPALKENQGVRMRGGREGKMKVEEAKDGIADEADPLDLGPYTSQRSHPDSSKGKRVGTSRVDHSLPASIKRKRGEEAEELQPVRAYKQAKTDGILDGAGFGDEWDFTSRPQAYYSEHQGSYPTSLPGYYQPPPNPTIQQVDDLSDYPHFTPAPSRRRISPRSARQSTRLDPQSESSAVVNARHHAQQQLITPPSSTEQEVISPSVFLHDELSGLPANFDWESIDIDQMNTAAPSISVNPEYQWTVSPQSLNLTSMQEHFSPLANGYHADAPPHQEIGMPSSHQGYGIPSPEQSFHTPSPYQALGMSAAQSMPLVGDGIHDPWNGTQLNSVLTASPTDMVQQQAFSLDTASNEVHTLPEHDMFADLHPPLNPIVTTMSEPLTRRESPDLESTSLSAPPTAGLSNPFDLRDEDFDSAFFEELEASLFHDLEANVRHELE